MVRATDHLYIVKDEKILNGEPIIKGTRTSVRAIVENWRMGIPPEEILQGLPHLTLAQIFVRRLLIILNQVTADEMKNQIRYI